MTSVDIAPILSALVQIVVPIVVALVGLVINRYVRNEEMRKALTGALEYGAQYGVARIGGAVAGKPVPVDVVIPVLAEGLNYVKTYTPQAVAWFKDRDEDIVRKLAARLPGVAGSITDDDIERAIMLSSLSGQQK